MITVYDFHWTDGDGSLGVWVNTPDGEVLVEATVRSVPSDVRDDDPEAEAYMEPLGYVLVEQIGNSEPYIVITNNGDWLEGSAARQWVADLRRSTFGCPQVQNPVEAP